VSNLTLTGQVSTMPQPTEFELMKQIASVAFNSKLIPDSIKTKEAALIIVMKGRELGIPPMQAFSSIAVVNGKPTMSAELMLALIYKTVSGAVIDIIKTTNDECLIEAQRPGGKRTTFSFTIRDAQAAGLAGKSVWKQYPAAMLRARCISSMARALFPDALSGVVYTAEELGATVDDEGRVTDHPKDVTPKDESHQEEVSEDIGDFEVKFGKHQGKTLNETTPENWIKYIHSVEQLAEREGKPLSYEAQTLKSAIYAYKEQQEAKGNR
jgi:hypothetical protein